MNGHDCTNNTQRNLSDCQVYTSVQALMAESVSKRLGLVHNGHWPVAGNGRLIAGCRSISDQSYRMLAPWICFSGLGHVWALSIFRLQIYGYVSSICTKAKTLLSLLPISHWLPAGCGHGRSSQLYLALGPRGSSPLLLWQRKCHDCYFIRVIDRDPSQFSLHLANSYW